MNIVFIGWNENGEKCLSTLLKSNIAIKKVLVPKGFETQEMFAIAKHYKVQVQETDGTHDEIKSVIESCKTDLLIVASFHKLLKKEIIDYPTFGVINVHAAALPHYRGYHPINWAIIKDEKTLGVTVHYIAEGTDNGDMLAQKMITVSDADDVTSLRKKLTSEGARLLLRVVKQISKSKKRIHGIKQNDSNASYAPRRYPDDGKIFWNDKTRSIFNLVRSLKAPYPNAFGLKENGEKVEVETTFRSKIQGQVLAKIKGYYLVTTSDGVIMIKTKKKLTIGEILK